MILPDWTPFNIAFYIFLSLLVVLAGPAEYYGMSMMNYSRFRGASGIPAMYGMVIGYVSPIIATTMIVWSHLRDASLIQWMIYLAIVIHFIKRMLECFFVHRFAGLIDLISTMVIASLYSFAAGLIGWKSFTTDTYPDVITTLGILVFFTGQAGSFYHHKLLADLRKNSLDYFIPKGGWFEYVACPHYFFEILAWLGIVLLSRHLAAWLVLLFIICYLTARALRVLKWYHDKFNNFPKDRRAILPFVL